MLGLGKYSQHRKLNSEPEQDDLCGDREIHTPDNEDVYNVLYLGHESIKGCQEQDYPNVVKKIYGKNFSPLNAVVQSKKLLISVSEYGILVAHPPGSGKAGIISMSFNIPNIAYVSSNNNHKKVLAIVCHGLEDDVVLNVFVCEDDEAPIAIMEQSIQKINKENCSRKLLDIKKSNFPAAIAFKYEESLEIVPKDEKSITVQNARPDQESIKELDLEDEFSQLAMKRNVTLPEHLQDKTPESTLLIQDEQNGRTSERVNEQNKSNNSFFKTNFFSSYSRVSTGTS